MSNEETLIAEVVTQEDRDALTRLAVKTAREDLLAFILLLNPGFSVAPHHRLICDKLMSLEAGELRRLMLFVAPRSSKSLISSIYYPAWLFGKHGDWQFLGVSHSATLATKFGRTVRDIIQSRQFKVIFPEVHVNPGQSAKDHWSIILGPRIKDGLPGGEYLAAGAGQPIAGHGAHQGMIDDPISEQDAWSEAKRNTVNEWYPGGFRSRLMPGGRVGIIQTRWHEMDLSGYLLRLSKEQPLADQWEVIRIPVLNTSESTKLLNNARDKLIDQGYLKPDYPELQPGESFWPAPSETDNDYHWPTSEVLATKHSMPEHQFDAIYMQVPSSKGGNILRAADWQKWDMEKHKVPPVCDYIIQSWDTAFSTKESADFSACTTWGVFQEEGKAHLVLLGATKGRWAYPTLRQNVIEKFNEHHPDVIIMEKKASGQSLIQELSLTGIPMYPFTPEKDKITRAHLASEIFAQKRIWYPSGRQWAQDVIDECTRFPADRHDDYVDTVSQAVMWMRFGGWVDSARDRLRDVDEYDTMSSTKSRVYY